MLDVKNRLKISEERKAQLEDKMKYLEQQVTNREKEITRLSAKLQSKNKPKIIMKNNVIAQFNFINCR